MVLCSRASFIAGTQQKIRDRMKEEKNNNNEVSGMLMMMRKKVEEKKEFPITIAAVSSSLPWILRFFAILKGFTNLLCYSRVVRLDPCALPSCHHCSSPLRFWVLLRVVSHGMQTSKTPSISYQRVPFSFPRPWFFLNISMLVYMCTFSPLSIKQVLFIRCLPKNSRLRQERCTTTEKLWRDPGD